ncbi:MAG: orotate phosphoribosyltransferase [Ferroplasma sp.]
MERDEFIKYGIIKFGDFILTSGQKSTYYVDIKEACTDPIILGKIIDGLSPMVIYGQISGMELGSVPLLVGLSLKLNIRYAIVRKSEREHGTGKRIVGTVEKNSKIDIIEDVVTTGNSILKTADILRKNGAIVDHAICVVDREAGGTELLKENGIALASMAKISELMK